MNNSEHTPSQLIYLVESPEDSTVLIAINLEHRQSQKIMAWFDTVKERIMEYKTIEISPTHTIHFTRTTPLGDMSYNLRPLTLELYNEKVKQYLISPKPFQTEDEMHKALLNTVNHAW
ncbi:MAG: hypothetical protein HYZ69_00955 [Candidatus Colwellbacteria bacterium]|nr:hypothetical protein [Candidatus Colwellbacteria bacterium]